MPTILNFHVYRCINNSTKALLQSHIVNISWQPTWRQRGQNIILCKHINTPLTRSTDCQPHKDFMPLPGKNMRHQTEYWLSNQILFLLSCANNIWIFHVLQTALLRQHKWWRFQHKTKCQHFFGHINILYKLRIFKWGEGGRKVDTLFYEVKRYLETEILYIQLWYFILHACFTVSTSFLAGCCILFDKNMCISVSIL